MDGIELTIRITAEGQEKPVLTRPHEYRSLMHLITDKLLLDGFGECCGMGKCGTCIVEITSCTGSLTSLERNECTTLERAGKNRDNLRLSCQILIDESINELTINIP
jgi:2Fe-2S ferredoxin